MGCTIFNVTVEGLLTIHACPYQLELQETYPTSINEFLKRRPCGNDLWTVRTGLQST